MQLYPIQPEILSHSISLSTVFRPLELMMTRGPSSILLLLAMSLPGAARALGLGDIRIDSALDEPLSAQIDIVGATRDELAALTAGVANREVFQRYGADRPAFLSTATFRVGMDANGHAVLNVRSAQAFTDPLVSFLVDIRWGKNELVREYSLLLNPPNDRMPRPAGDVALAAAMPNAPKVPGNGNSVEARVAHVSMATDRAQPSRPARSLLSKAPTTRLTHALATSGGAAPAAASQAPGTAAPDARARITVAAGDTLRSIARRAGARTETAAQTLMIAIFRANPVAFDDNINRLHRGSVLNIPTAAELGAIAGADAKREVRAQMTAWRLGGRPGPAPRGAAGDTSLTAVMASTAAPAPALAAAAMPAPAKLDIASESSLKSRVQELEQQLADVHQQLSAENVRVQALNGVSRSPSTAAASAVSANAVELVRAPILNGTPSTPSASWDHNPQTSTRNAEVFGPVALTLGLLVGGFAYVRRRLTRIANTKDAAVDAPRYPTPAADVAVAPDSIATPAALMEPMSPLDAFRPMARPVGENPSRGLSGDMDDTTEQPRPQSTTETTANLDIDIEALERSYLESMPDEAAIEASLADTTVHKAGVHPRDVDTAVDESDLNTVLLDVKAREMGSGNAVRSQDLVNATALDFNLMDLDATAQHVQMPSELTGRPVMQERRKNIIDVLKTAIERDPQRRDLRMKLLETYYSLAVTNQRGFMDVVRRLSREKNLITADDWKQITMMGREIAADDILFADLDPPKDNEDLAHCA